MYSVTKTTDILLVALFLCRTYRCCTTGVLLKKRGTWGFSNICDLGFSVWTVICQRFLCFLQFRSLFKQKGWHVGFLLIQHQRTKRSWVLFHACSTCSSVSVCRCWRYPAPRLTENLLRIHWWEAWTVVMIQWRPKHKPRNKAVVWRAKLKHSQRGYASKNCPWDWKKMGFIFGFWCEPSRCVG